MDNRLPAPPLPPPFFLSRTNGRILVKRVITSDRLGKLQLKRRSSEFASLANGVFAFRTCRQRNSRHCGISFEPEPSGIPRAISVSLTRAMPRRFGSRFVPRQSRLRARAFAPRFLRFSRGFHGKLECGRVLRSPHRPRIRKSRNDARRIRIEPISQRGFAFRDTVSDAKERDKIKSILETDL